MLKSLWSCPCSKEATEERSSGGSRPGGADSDGSGSTRNCPSEPQQPVLRRQLVQSDELSKRALNIVLRTARSLKNPERQERAEPFATSALKLRLQMRLSGSSLITGTFFSFIKNHKLEGITKTLHYSPCPFLPVYLSIYLPVHLQPLI